MSTKAQYLEGLAKVRGAIPLLDGMTRRNFVAGAAAAAATAIADEPPAKEASAAEDAAAAAAATSTGMTFAGNEGKTMGEVLGAGWLGEEPAMPEISQTLESDIAIMGMGHAGTACARKASKLDANAIIDKQYEDAFNVLGNDIGHLNSAWQTERCGIPRYDGTTFMNEYQFYSAGRAQPTLVRDFAYRSGEAFDWFIDSFTEEEKDGIVALNWPVAEGYDYQKGMFTSYVGTPNFGSSVGLAEALLRTQQIAKNNGAQFICHTTGVRLAHSEDGTEVTGIVAQDLLC